MVFSGLIDFLFPRSDAVYRLESLTPEELLASLPKPAETPDESLALWSYGDPLVRELVWEIKYRRNAVLTASVAHILLKRLSALNLTGPILIPMPMSKKRRLERGWNQTECVCEALMRACQGGPYALEYMPNALEKIRHTESQTLIENKRQRQRNLEGSMEARDVERMRNRNIIIFDDVVTTGASFKEARRALRKSGARRIICVALAH